MPKPVVYFVGEMKRLLLLLISGVLFGQVSAQITKLTICKGMSINYFSIITSGNAVAWNWTFPGGTPGTSTQQNPTNITYPTAGTYRTVVVTKFNTGKDTTQYIDVEVIDGSIKSIPIGRDTTVCGNVNLLLDAGNPGAKYFWNPGGAGSRTRLITTPGRIGVSVVTYAGQFQCDSQYREIFIKQSTPPTVDLGADRFVCNSNPITLDAGPDGASYAWFPGGETSRSIQVSSSGIFSVTVTNADGCKTFDQVEVKDSCPMYVWMPDAFTPNGDNLNDVFLWKGNMKFRSYQFAVYNRWGAKMFETNDPATGWDGYYGGKRAQEGVFVYRITGVDTNGKRHSWKGTFTLVY